MSGIGAASGPSKYMAHTPTGETDNVGQFCAQYDVYEELLPFPGRRVSRLDFIEATRAHIQERPLTAQYWTFSHVLEALGVSRETITHLHPSAVLFGTWKLPDAGSHATDRFVNPNYVHLDTLPRIESERDRLRYAREAARYGFIELTDIAPAWGVSDSAVSGWLLDRSVRYGELRAEGRRRMGRTIYMAHEWGVPYRRYADVLDVSRTTLQTWAYRWGRDDPEFEPPQYETLEVPR